MCFWFYFLFQHILCVLMKTMCHPVYYQNGFVATHALGQMTIRQMTHFWYQRTNNDHFIYQGFPNSAMRWEVGISPLKAGKSYILLERRIFLIGLWEPEEE